MDINPNYPRPLLRRGDWISLDGTWEFIEDHGDIGLERSFFREPFHEPETIIVPYPPESVASGISRDVADTLWYRREVELPPAEVGMRRLLHFEAVDYRAQVWVNGHLAGSHEGGQTRFTLDVTALARSGPNVITVRANDVAQDLEQPRGKQDWQTEPHVIWYRRSSGIWRSVWLEEVPNAYIEDLVFVCTPTYDVEATVSISGKILPEDRVRLRFAHEGTVLAEASYLALTDRVESVIKLTDSRLTTEPDELTWSPERPNLIDVRVELVRAGEVVDIVDSYLGLRTVSVDDRAILLNNRPYFLRMVLEQGYWPESQLAAPSSQALREEVELIKSLGFNGIRVHQKAADPRFLSWCDRLGLLVWAEAAASFQFSDRAFRRLTNEWAEIVVRDRAHPSVVAWIAYNESWGVPQIEHRPQQQSAVRAMHALIKTLDPSRIVVGNDGWENLVGDVIGVHDYGQDPARLAGRFGTLEATRSTVREGRTGGRSIALAGAPDRGPVLLSEFGGINLHQDGEAWSGYGDARNEEDFLGRLKGLVASVGPTSGLAGFCYTQLTDTEQEQNGLTSALRVPKVPSEELRSIFGSD